MKKGFTLVELAIVLIVIGLLLGMAFKGKALVDAARIKAEVNKVEKLGTAINVYYSKYDTIPGTRTSVPLAAGGTADDNSSAAVYQTLLNEGMLKDSDFKSTIGSAYWTFIGCSHANNGWTLGPVSENSNLCIYRSSNTPDKFKTKASSGAIAQASVTGINICQIETLLDDKNLGSGDGRLVSGQDTAASKVDNITWNCADTTLNGTNPGAVEYLYRIF